MDNDRFSARSTTSRDLLTYLRYIFLAALAIGLIVAIQLGFVLKTYQPQYLVVPIALAITLGLLFGHVSILRRRLLHKSHLFRAVADFAQEFTYIRHLDGRYEYVSPSCADLTGYTAEEFYASPNLMDKLIHQNDVELWRQHIHQINNAGQPVTMDLRLVSRSGKTIWFSHICAPVFDIDGRQTGVRSANIDITDKKRIERRIRHMAYYDLLTDLPNRRSLTRFIDNLTHKLNASNEKFAVLFLDLDRFKHINDSFHHEFGDHLLSELAKRLRNSCKDHDFISRFGGDEFVIVILQLDDPLKAIAYAQRLIEIIEQPFIITDRELYISGCIGIAIYPYDGQDATTLIRNADAAMYQAKKQTQNCSLYSRQLIDDATTFITTDNRIRQGLGNGEFIAHYQPKVDIGSGAIIGMEALARWQTSDRGLVMPDDFIYIAEETGLIIPLGIHVLEQVCQQMRTWIDQGLAVPAAVNISAKQFAHPQFIDTVTRIITEYAIEPQLLEFEITEQVFLRDIDSAIDTLWQLKNLGISIAMDDFGTGYSSLNYIKRLPVDTLKIDRSFTKDILKDSRDIAILKAILSLCRDLKLNTVVEGIETPEQAELLAHLGCSRAQGFLYYRPMPADALTEIIKQKNADELQQT